MTDVIHSTCYMCTEDCPITVVTDGEDIVSVEYPECPRAEAMLEQRTSALRLTRARVRRDWRGGARGMRGLGGEWQEVSREEAVSTAAQKLLEVRNRHGPQAVAFLAGFTKEPRPYLKRLAHGFGSPHYLTESSCCFASGFIAARLTLGREYEYFLGPSRTRYPETKCRLIWSANPAQSRLPYERHHLLTDVRHVPMVVVDPRRTSLAEAASIHLQLRPGTDGALALGLAHVILEEGLEDRAFLLGHAHGLDPYRDYVKGFSPDRVARVTGVEPDLLVAAARLYGTSRPAQITISACSTVHHHNGFQNHRAILLLAALCGNLDVLGGNRPWGHRIIETSVDLDPGVVASLGTPLGTAEHPLFVEHYGEGQGMQLARAIEKGDVKAVFSLGMNVMMWPNSARLRSAVRSLEFFTACDFFETPTTELATVFFPAATHLEREALVVSGSGRVQLRPATVAPLGDAIGDSELVFEMARSLGLDDPFWEKGLRASYDARLAGLGLSLADLPQDGEAVQVEVSEPEEKAYLRNGFGTPTGKVEFVSTGLENAGYDGLPTYREPHWSPVSTPELARGFPLVLTSGARSRIYTHSQGRALSTLTRREPEPRVQISPTDATARSIADGDEVRLFSPLGSVTMKASVTDRLPPGVVSAPHGWAQADINRLLPDEGLDPVSGFPPFRSSLCEVERLGRSGRVDESDES